MAQSPPIPGSLLATLNYQPQPLKFGTSGRRGEVMHLTQLEIYLNALAELEYLQSLATADGGIRAGEEFFFAYDLRPSSTHFVPEQGGRGEIAQAICRAIEAAGMIPVNLGAIPTPALTFYALGRGKGSIMVTGSHIPFDRNGYKTNSAKGELLKKNEAPINARVEIVRQRLYAQPFTESPFDTSGRLKTGHQDLPPARQDALRTYTARYTDFFAGASLAGKRLVVYQHSAVGRDMLVDVLCRFGAETIPMGRSETFVPIDTEAIDAGQLATIQGLCDDAWKTHGPIDAVVSIDGDSDRPLVLGIEPGPAGQTGRVRFFGGDLVGMVVAEFLGADAVVVPISCNDALDRGPLESIVQPKTRIGSPFVIAGMEKARGLGRRAVCGWEANGGFLTGSDLTRDAKTLTALPTRDALLPILSVLLAAARDRVSVAALFDRLPRRFSKAALLRKFPRPVSQKVVCQFSPADPAIDQVIFEDNQVALLDANQNPLPATDQQRQAMAEIRRTLEQFFTSAQGFDRIARLNYTDGVRLYFANGDVAHVRPSGNADELRIYAVADTQARADAIANAGSAEPDGILRKLERSVSDTPAANPVQKLVGTPGAGSEALRRAGSIAEESGSSECLRTGVGGGSDEAMSRRAVAAFVAQPGLLPITGVVQHYDWGGFDFIPRFLAGAGDEKVPPPADNQARKPFAELWFGTHPNGPATVDVQGHAVALTALADAAAEQLFGVDLAVRYQRRMPYLLKVLDARKMLSIQAHPTIAQAREGYAREDAAGISLKAPNRNYKDLNHKPEVHVALTNFWMLHGFRPLEEIAGTLGAVAELATLMPDFSTRLERAGKVAQARRELLRELYLKAMTMPQEQVDEMLKPLAARLAKSGKYQKDDVEFWALRAAEDFPLPGGHLDRGIFSIYLLNLVHLKPGEATYQAAGTLHAYLEGVNVELMANSDNVLRGGLTPKHIDATELMKVVRFDSGKPAVITGDALSATETVYRTPAEEFEIRRLQVAPGQPYAGKAFGAEVLICTEGSAAAIARGQSLNLPRGSAILVPHGIDYAVEARGSVGVVFKAAMPVTG